MFDKLYNMVEHHSPSYKDRLKSIDDFFQAHGLYKELWPEQPDEPLSIVWSVATKFPEIFMQQLGSLMQLDGILKPQDEIILVADVERKADVLSSKFMTKQCPTTGVIIERPFRGDGPAINWDVGISYAKHDRILCMRDLGLYFNPWYMLKEAREAPIKNNLYNFSSVLGPVWSRFQDKWLYLVHPRFAPNPFLFSFVLSKENYEAMGGFDTRLGRGFDHTGELDFLLRWNMKGYSYHMSEDTHIFHPGMAADSQEEMQMMQFESSINRRYFFDRYGEDFINKLQPPYKADVNMIEVSHALTLDPLSEAIVCEFTDFDPVKDAFSFSKIPTEEIVKEVI